MMKIITDLFLTAFYTVFVQNLVFSSGLGMSEAFRVSTKPGSFGKIAAMISGFSVVTSAFCSLVNLVSGQNELTYAVRAVIYGIVLAALYAVVAIFAKMIFRASDSFLSTLGIAAFNTLVFAIPHINNSAAYSFAGSIGSGLGAGIAFVVAAALINKGLELIKENEEIPEAFKGKPAMFIYVALISLAFAGFSDKNIFG